MNEILLNATAKVEYFLERWYGNAKYPKIGNIFMNEAAPFALIRWHTLAARVGTRITFQDYPIALRDLGRDADGMLPFWVENQNGIRWAVGSNDSSHAVFYRQSGSGTWKATGENLEGFLLHCTIREACIGAEQKFTVLISEAQLSEALDSFSELSFPALASEEPATRMWSSNDALVRVGPPPAGYEEPDDPLWMLIFAVPRDGRIDRYVSRFGLNPSDFIARATKRLSEPPPF